MKILYRNNSNSPLQSGSINRGVPRYDTESSALFGQMGVVSTVPDSLRAYYYNEVLKDLKYYNYLNELDYFYLRAAHSKPVTLIDIVNPTTRVSTITNDHASSWTQDRYLTGRSLSSFRVDMGINFGDGGNHKFKTNNASFGLYINSRDTTNTGIDLSGGSPANAENQIILFGTSGSARVTLNREQSSSESYNQMYGWHQGRIMTGETKSNYYKNGIKKDENTATGAATTPYNNQLFEFCSHNDAAFSNYSNRTHSAGYGGSGVVDPGIISGIGDKYLIGVGAIPSRQIIIHGNSFTAENTYVNRLFSNYTSSNFVQDCVRGKAGYTTAQLIADFPTNVRSCIKPFYNQQYYFFWELLNSMLVYNSNKDLAYADLVTYCNMVKATGVKKLFIGTMLPSAGIDPTKRQNPNDLYDTSTLNGLIRTNFSSFCDGYVDFARDPIIGIDSGGVAGVGEKNTTYFAVDERHLIPFGYTYCTDNYLYPSVRQYIN